MKRIRLEKSKNRAVGVESVTDVRQPSLQRNFEYGLIEELAGGRNDARQQQIQSFGLSSAILGLPLPFARGIRGRLQGHLHGGRRVHNQQAPCVRDRRLPRCFIALLSQIVAIGVWCMKTRVRQRQ